MITATPCLLTYHHEPGVSDPSRLLRAPSTDYAKALAPSRFALKPLALGPDLAGKFTGLAIGS
jgi:hypothetical protein